MAKGSGKKKATKSDDYRDSGIEAPEVAEVETTKPAPRPVGTKAYWMGTLGGSPRQNVTLGGVTFHRTKETVQYIADSGQTIRTARRGSIEQLTPDQVEAINVASTRLVVRERGTRANVYSTEGRHFRAHEGDTPISAYLYMIAVDEAVATHGAEWFMEEDPEPMA